MVRRLMDQMDRVTVQRVENAEASRVALPAMWFLRLRRWVPNPARQARADEDQASVARET